MTRRGIDARRLRRYVPTALQPLARRAFLEVGRSTAQLRMSPSFMVIGGQRCGTTSIFKHLAEHPQVMRPPVEKGTDYYTLHYCRGSQWYRGHFPLRMTGSRRAKAFGQAMAFEACTYYMFHPLAISRIAEDFPDIKLVAMLRDPAERAFSAYKHEFARGFETEPVFERALELEDSRLAGEIERICSDPDYESLAHRHHAYRRRGQFSEQLDRVLASFPRNQLHIMESEAFFQDPVGEYGELLDFLQLDRHTPRAFEQHNARPSSPMDERVRRELEEHYRPYDERLAEIMGHEPRWRR